MLFDLYKIVKFLVDFNRQLYENEKIFYNVGYGYSFV